MFSQSDIQELIDKAFEAALEKFKKQDYKDADIILSQSIKIQPDNSKILHLIGITKYALQDYENAIKYFNLILDKDPDDFETLNNISLAYGGLGNFNLSVDFLKKALKVKSNASVHNNLGVQLRHQGNLKEAIYHFNQSKNLCECDTEIAKAYAMIAGCYGEMKDLNKSEKYLNKALKFDNNLAGAHLDLSNIYQLRGEWSKSWAEYEYRHDVFEQLKIWRKIYNAEKQWKGESLEGKILIVHGEQGHGDCIHFFRYIKFLKCKVILHCSEILKTLLQPYVDEIYTTDPVAITDLNEIPFHDYHCSIMSLPYVLNASFIPPAPYIHVDTKLEMFNYEQFLKIGIVWTGNPQHPNDKYRSCYLKNFKQIHDLQNVKLFSLVKDTRNRIYRFEKDPIDYTEGADDMKIIDMAPFMNSFKDTAEIMNSMDLIISVDTSSLHLAGAMGIPTLGLLSWNNDWRWGLTGEISEWYPTVKLFRQKKLGEWNHVFQEIKQEIIHKYLLHKGKVEI